MSTLKVTNIAGLTGSSTDVMQGLCKAWCSINMDSASVRDSFGTSSITDNNTGNFTIDFSNALTNSNYPALMGQQALSGSDSYPSWNASNGGQTPTTTRHYLGGWEYAGNEHDVQYSYIALLGDLA
jgi:hypothetical protein